MRKELNDYNQTTVAVVMVILGTGVVGSGLGIAWWRAMSRGPVERDTIFFIIKLFMGIAAVGIIITILARYVFV
jgi:hypothetical protein